MTKDKKERDRLLKIDLQIVEISTNYGFKVEDMSDGTATVSFWNDRPTRVVTFSSSADAAKAMSLMATMVVNARAVKEHDMVNNRAVKDKAKVEVAQ